MRSPRSIQTVKGGVSGRCQRPWVGVLPQLRHPEQQIIGEPWRGDLEPERKTTGQHPGRERDGWMAGHILQGGGVHLRWK